MRTYVAPLVIGIAAVMIGILAAGPITAGPTTNFGAAMLLPTYGPNAPTVLLARDFPSEKMYGHDWDNYPFFPYYTGYSGYGPRFGDQRYGVTGFGPGTQLCRWNGSSYQCSTP
jgi:hypothetical protein